MKASFTPRVSVIVPVHNRDWCISDALESALATPSANNLEIVVVDDGSTDGTPDIVDTFAGRDSRVRVITHPHRANRGIAASRNLGVAASRGTYLAFLDSDDLFLPTRFDTALSWLDANPAFTACIEPSSIQRFDGSEPAQTRLHLASVAGGSMQWLKAMLFDTIYWPMCAITVRRESFSGFGRFDERLRFGEETAIWLKLVAAGAVGMAQASTPVCIVRRHSQHSHGADVVANLTTYLHILVDVLMWTKARTDVDTHGRELLLERLRTYVIEMLANPAVPLGTRLGCWCRALLAAPSLAADRRVGANLARAPFRGPAGQFPQ